MKLGLAEEQSVRPPTILILGEGALAEQMKSDFLELGLHAQLVGGAHTDHPLPKLTDFDAKEQFEALFRHWIAETGAQWVHPGVTLWSERSEFEGWARQGGFVLNQRCAEDLALVLEHPPLDPIGRRHRCAESGIQ